MTSYQNILIVRTDRLGDVVLTTPVIAALRKACPKARISIMVRNETRDVVEGNLYLDQVIVYDREKTHKGPWGFWKFIFRLRREKFDLAIVLHTKKITNAICFLAGIPHRLGYKNEKFGFLLTHPLPDTRWQGTKHESEYCLDVLKALGIRDVPPEFYVPVQKEGEAWVQQFFLENQIKASERLIAVHPGASCISKRWPAQNFAEVINRIQNDSSARIVLIGKDDPSRAAGEILAAVKGPVVDLTGKTSVSQLISLLKRCHLLISNDSGPVHVASALGVPVVAIFGRNQAGLSPTRWRPWGEKSLVLHKEVGCPVCLAHRCQIDFKCLKEISPQEVLEGLTRCAQL